MERWKILCIFVTFLCSGLSGCDKDSPTSPQYFERLVYVAMGASDAVGIGAFPLEKGYVYQIRDALKSRADEVVLYNLGVSGKRINYIESTELPTAISVQPHVLTIWAGPNDLIHGVDAATFEQSLATVLMQLRQSTSAVIVLANIPDLTLLPRFLIDPDPDVTVDRVHAFNLALARQAGVYAVPLVDLYAGDYASNWDYVSLDGFHPSNEGHTKIAELYLEILLKSL
ncbi:lipolytic protein G-D-S-L family [Candidatus Vecturithrix granuli]|uniref:Lipolytic protein G-D-S-L family n=1 Tax=Vecturithrix granuli TaxID=1499967 RepID=A0A081C5J9_VECG1|nr:lipolytic protein G-D-S-L family [Candidatus Vecturithrix granuli]